MNRLIARLLPATALPPRARPPISAGRAEGDAADAAARLALQGGCDRRPVDAAASALVERPAACGWFDSSHELHCGLAVQEWPDDDWAVAALYFAGLRPAAPRWQ